MELTLPDAEQCRVSAEMVGGSDNPLRTAFYPAISMEDGPTFNQVTVTPAGGLGALANRSIFLLLHQPNPLQQQPFFWSLPEATEEPAPESPRLPADANQESTQFDPRVGAWVREVSERFDYLLSLLPGWDGHEAVPIKSEHVLAAGRFLSAVMAPETAAPAIVPTADGGVQLEWHQGGVDVEVLFSDCEEDVALYVHDLASGNEWEGPAIEGFSEFELASRLGT